MIIATPYYAGVHPKTIESVKRLPRIVDWRKRKSTLIWRGRNHAIQGGKRINLLKRQSVTDDVLNLDADIGFSVNQYERIQSHGLSIVGGAYNDRHENCFCGGWIRDGAVEYVTRDRTGLIEVDWIGAGFLFVRKDVFDKIEYPWFRPWLWEFGDSAEFMGEDVGFCMQAREAGYKIYMDCDCRVQHFPSTRGGVMPQNKQYTEFNPNAILNALANISGELLAIRKNLEVVFQSIAEMQKANPPTEVKQNEIEEPKED